MLSRFAKLGGRGYCTGVMYPLGLLRRVTPKGILDMYHRTLSGIAAVWYGHPSRRMIVIGVTGTSGKTTVCYLLARLLEHDGVKTGMLTTALFKIGDNVWDNRTKMTMLGRFQTQKMLRDMAKAGCRYAIVETTSQGIMQHRHEHIAYDVAVLTNLWPEHVEAHGGFAAYKQAKQRLFASMVRLPRKTLDGRIMPRVQILNAENEHAHDFVMEGFDRTVWFGADTAFAATEPTFHANGSDWMINGVHAHVNIPGSANVENALAALAAADAVGISLEKAVAGLSSVNGLPGRYERIDEGQSFTVMVDYAFEPGAMERLYEMVASLPHRRIIHVLGATGGGRDTARRPVLGRMAGMHADVVIVTNEDPYDDDPAAIMRDVAAGAHQAGRREGEDLFLIEDRREAIQEAIRLAEPDDLVLITGKGSEPVMAVANGKKIPWDDREEVRNAIRKRIRS